MLTTFALYGGLIFLTAFMGGALPVLFPNLHENQLKLFISFSAGLLLAMSFLHMLPEASLLVPSTFGLWLLFGFLILMVLERFVMVHACEEHGCHYHTVGLAAFGGLAVHGVIEGFALASSVFVGKLGLLVLVAILAHKAPAGFALSSILSLSGKSRTQILLFAAGVAISGPIGLFLAYGLIQAEGVESTTGALLAMSAGTFFYISACDLLPELHRTDSEKFKRLAGFALGILVAFLSGLFVDVHAGHSHAGLPTGDHSHHESH